MNRQEHWENVYTTKSPLEVSWYQVHAVTSLALIERSGVKKTAQIIDVGGGASTLADDLLAKGYENLTVLDISAAALELAKRRMESKAERVKWLAVDATQANLQPQHYDVWHDRAVFHFLTDTEDRAKYVRILKDTVRPGGHIIIATFALDGPPRCSGLEVARYSPETLLAELGSGIELAETFGEMHPTPFGTQQSFVYCCFRKT